MGNVFCRKPILLETSENPSYSRRHDSEVLVHWSRSTDACTTERSFTVSLYGPTGVLGSGPTRDGSLPVPSAANGGAGVPT